MKRIHIKVRFSLKLALNIPDAPGMVEGVGCCSICARVCHRDCDVTYSKHGSFFCDCGAREDGSCGALTVRNSSAGVDGQR